MKRFAILVCAFAAASSAFAQQRAEPDYLDDRSTPQALVKSLYNAVDRREYGRAWSYFDEEKPVATVEEFAKGYETTQSVQLLVGDVTADGAAGSTFYAIPVAIKATGADGNARVFGGCYTARLANPALQEVDFKPMHFVRGKLAPHDGPLEAALPKSCAE